MLHTPKNALVAAAIAGGATLLSTSAARAQQAAPPPAWTMQAPPRYRNPSMRVAGIVLTSIGSAALAAGLIVTTLDLTVWNHNCDESCGLVAGLIGLPLVGGSALFAGIGIPLWVVGSRPPAGQAALPGWVPTPVPARNGAGLRWTF